MRVNVSRRADRAMAEDFLNHAERAALGEQKSCGRMAQIVEARRLGQAGRLGEGFEAPVKVARLERCADRAHEHKAGLSPAPSCREAFLKLAHSMSLKRSHDSGGGGHGQSAPGAIGLGAGCPELSFDAL